MEKDKEGRKISWKKLKKSLWVYSYMKPYRGQFFLGVLFLFINSSGNVLLPRLLGLLVDRGNKGGSLEHINKIMLVLSGILVLQAIAGFTRTNLFIRVTSKTLAAIRQAIYAHLIKLPLSFYLKHRVGELNSRISSDISMLEETLASSVATFLRSVVTIVGALVFLLFISPHLTLFMLLIMPLLSVLAVFFTRFIRKYSKKMQSEIAESNTIVEETLQGIQNVKSYANEFFEIKRYTKRMKEVVHSGILGGVYRGALSAFMILGMTGAMVTVIWRGTILIANGSMDSGELFSFVLYTLFIAGMIGSLADVYAQIQKTIGATENLFEILGEPEEEVEPVKEIDKRDVLNGDIKFEHVGFHYPTRSDIEVVKALSFHIQPNQKVAIVGPSGAGKSTLVNLLLRFYNVITGEIKYNNRNINEFSLSALRSQIAIVPQDVFLFGGTIRENIAYGKLDATEKEIIQAARQASAWDFIRSFPEGLDCVVGERGVQLSGGQRQRIAIARAILKNPRLLILDEATSSLDSESEYQVQEALDKLMEGRTTIIIAHRLSTIRKADRIIVLENGQMVQSGRHEELVEEENGLYANLSKLQFIS